MDKSGGGKAVPQQHSGSYVLKHNKFCIVDLQLYIAYLYMIWINGKTPGSMRTTGVIIMF